MSGRETHFKYSRYSNVQQGSDVPPVLKSVRPDTATQLLGFADVLRSWRFTEFASWRLQLTTLTFNLPFCDAKQAGSLAWILRPPGTYCSFPSGSFQPLSAIKVRMKGHANGMTAPPGFIRLVNLLYINGAPSSDHGRWSLQLWTVPYRPTTAPVADAGHICLTGASPLSLAPASRSRLSPAMGHRMTISIDLRYGLCAGDRTGSPRRGCLWLGLLSTGCGAASAVSRQDPISGM